MHPFSDYSIPHPYKIGRRMRPRDAIRLKLPDGVPGDYLWVCPNFFAYAQVTPDWYFQAVDYRKAVAVALLEYLPSRTHFQ